ncbi:putative aryl-alcohol dehydrogenase Aad16p [Trichomonascus vanleenenianus]|uniref:aldo/keto reductase n=1 Tax=Trichomonascus vanleenenianus TaxID=2268995 RepID=UPI003EC9EBB1
MEYVRLGNSGLKISRIILGAMSFGTKQWADWVIEDEELVMQLLKQAYDAGIRTIDTADVYSNGQSEVLVGKFLKKYSIPRSTVVILTKVFFVSDNEKGSTATIYSQDSEFENRKGLSRKHIMDAVERSVSRLGTYIDVLQIHRFDSETPIEETMCALNDVVKSGQVRYIGASSMRAWQFVMMQECAEKNGWHKFISMQNHHSLLYREEEREMNPYCEATKVGLIPWSPLSRGMLARPRTVVDTERFKSDRYGQLSVSKYSQAEWDIIDRVEEIAKKKGVSMAEVAIAWSLSKGNSPILGLNKPERIDEAVAALKVKLTEEETKYLEELYVPKAVEGHAN